MDEEVRANSYLFKSSFIDAFKNSHGNVEAVVYYKKKRDKQKYQF